MYCVYTEMYDFLDFHTELYGSIVYLMTCGVYLSICPYILKWARWSGFQMVYLLPKPTQTFSIISTGNNAFVAEQNSFLMRLPVRHAPAKSLKKSNKKAVWWSRWWSQWWWWWWQCGGGGFMTWLISGCKLGGRFMTWLIRGIWLQIRLSRMGVARSNWNWVWNSVI
jgi:hypothetical protein